MKRTKAKRVTKGILRGVAALLALVLLVVGFFGVKGYLMYQNAVKENPIAELAGRIKEEGAFVSYGDLPAIYIDAVISAEDKRFETHCGIDLRAIARAAWTDLKTMSFVEGGSTITQQIAKNQLFSQEKSIERKFAEVYAAFALEKEYSKQELFELYVNSIYFGSGYYGIGAAAQGYFHKEPKDLTDSEAVLLAGLPNAPSVYSPDENLELARKRMLVVLNRMMRCGKITLEDAARILNEE